MVSYLLLLELCSHDDATEMLPALDNFVSYGTDVFKARSDYREMIVDIYTSTISSEHLGENDRVNGCRLAEAILLNLRGSVDDVSHLRLSSYLRACSFFEQHLERIITTALDLQGKPETKALVLANLEVIINAILYNPAAALQIMETSRPGMARAFFDQWFTAINTDGKLPRVHDKKLCIMTLCAMMEMNPAVIPDNLREVWGHVVNGALRMFKDLPKAIRGISGFLSSPASINTDIDRKILEESLEEESEDEEIGEEGKLLNLNEDEDGEIFGHARYHSH